MKKKMLRFTSLLLCALMLSCQISAAAVEPSSSQMKCVTTEEDLAEFYAEDAHCLNNTHAHLAAVQQDNRIVEPMVEVIYEGHDYEEEMEGDALIPEIARGTSTPSSYWNLSTKGRYLATINKLSSGTLYTDYYFDFLPFTHTDADLEGVQDGKIYVKYTVYTWDGSLQTCKLKLTLYCKDCREALVSHTSNAAGARDDSSGPVTTIVNFTSGNEHKDHFCYFKVQNAITSSSMYGSVKFGHSNADINS